MHLEARKNILDDVKIDADKSYLTLHIPISDYDIDQDKLFSYFEEYRGERYWFRSKNDTYNVVGIGYLKSIYKDKFSSGILSQEKASLYDNIQIIELSDELDSRLGLFGGTKFDHNQKTDEWNGFGMAEFHLPKWQFDLNNMELFCTLANDGGSLTKRYDRILDILSEIDAHRLRETEVPDVNMIKDIFPEEWKNMVDEAVAALDGEEFLKVVLARQRLITFKSGIQPLYLVQRLDDESGTYTIYYEKNDSTFISKSPEKLFDIKDNDLSTNAIAGSSERTHDEDDNDVSRNFLLNDSKNRYEHELVRASIVDDLKPHTHFVKYDEIPVILENKYIYHLHTSISARLKEDVDVFQLVDAIHPTPAVGGMPKKRAEQYIIDNEFGTRGLYAAPVGIIHENNDSEFVVSLRSMLIKQKSASLFAGGGIVRASDSDKEFEETNVKFTPMLNVLGVE